MDPESRGHAGVFALVFAAVVLLAGLWAGFAMERGDAPESGDPAPRGPAGPDPRVEADALCNELEQERNLDRVFPESVAFLVEPAEESPPPRRTPPGVGALAGAAEGDAILLTWEAAGDEPAAGWVVERLSGDGTVLDRKELPPEARSHRDGPLDALRGSRTYRVTALTADGEVAGAEQRVVDYRLEVRIEYRGLAPDGRAAFRVRVGDREPQEFLAAAGEEIGSERGGTDWRTGWTFVGPRGLRTSGEGTMEVPRFAPGGKLERNAETGEIVTDVRALPVPQVAEGAVVLPPDAPDEERWLPKSEN